MSHVSPNLLVTNNTFNTQFEPIKISGTQGSLFTGNVGNIGTVNHPYPRPNADTNYAAGITLQNPSRDYVKQTTGTVTNTSNQITSIANTTGIVQGVGQVVTGTGIPANTTVTTLAGSTVTMSANATGGSPGETIQFLTCGTTANAALDNLTDTIESNIFTSSNASPLYGIYISPSQITNTIEWNVLYPFGNPGTTAIQDSSGGSNTISNNYIDNAGTANLLYAAPAVADAGASMPIAASTAGTSVSVPLNGQAKAVNTATAALTAIGASCVWAQPVGSAVTIANDHACQTSFISPTTTTPVILGFKLTVTGPNGSTAIDMVYFGVDPSL